MTPSPVSGLSAATRLGAILANDAASAAAVGAPGVRIGLQRRQRGAVRAQARERRPFGRERLARAQALFERERGDRLRRGVALRRDLRRRNPRLRLRGGQRGLDLADPVAERGFNLADPVAERGFEFVDPVAERGLDLARPVAERGFELVDPGALRRLVGRDFGNPRVRNGRRGGRRGFPVSLGRRVRLSQSLGRFVARRSRFRQRSRDCFRLDLRGFQLRQALVDRVQRGRLGEARLPGLDGVDARPECLGFQRRRGRAPFQHAHTRGEVLRRIASRLVIPRRADRGRRADDRAAESPDERTAGRSLARGGRRPGWAGRGGFDPGFGRRLRRRFRRRHVCRRLRRVGRCKIRRGLARRGFALCCANFRRLAFDHDGSAPGRGACRTGFGCWGRLVGHSLSPMKTLLL